MRQLYSLLLYLATPFIVLRLIARGLKAHAYLQRWPERFGYPPTPRLKGCIWIHAVSVGEVRAAEPLVAALHQRYPSRCILLTTMTPTGADVAAGLAGVEHRYLPYDFPGAVRRFIDRIQPSAALIMETEIWPNLFHACRRKRIPLLLVNARLSDRSARGYRRWKSLAAETLGKIDRILVQGESDAANFLKIGADPERVEVTGNLKFDLAEPQAAVTHEDLAIGRPVWIAISTHDGEDEICLRVHQWLRQSFPDALLILAPRHPERFNAVARQCKDDGLPCIRYTGGETIDRETAVYLLDAMGVLNSFLAMADVAFVGGSLIDRGGHNLLEPAAHGVPVLTGASVFNFREITALLEEAGACQVVESDRELFRSVEALFTDPALRREAGDAGRAVVERYRGATQRTVSAIEQFI